MFDYFVGALPHFIAYFCAAIGLAVAFLTIYVAITPHKEFALIREGNTAASVQLTGTFIGFAIPVAMVISHSVNILDMLIWGAVAAIVQLLIFFAISRLLFRAIEDKIRENCVASGVFVGGIGLGVGVLQAACMVP